MTPHPAIAFAALVLLGGCGTAPSATMPAATTQSPAQTSTTVPATPSTLQLDTGAVATAFAVPVTPRTEPATTTTINPWEGLPCSEWAPTATAAGWPDSLMAKLLRTMWRESRCDMNARSTTSDSCAVQINDIVLRDWRFKRDHPNFDQATIFDPYVCLAVGWWLYTIDGWRPWNGGA